MYPEPQRPPLHGGCWGPRTEANSRGPEKVLPSSATGYMQQHSHSKKLSAPQNGQKIYALGLSGEFQVPDSGHDMTIAPGQHCFDWPLHTHVSTHVSPEWWPFFVGRWDVLDGMADGV